MLLQPSRHASPTTQRWNDAIRIGDRLNAGRLPVGTCGDETAFTTRVPDLDYRVQDGLLQVQLYGPLDLRCHAHLLSLADAVDASIQACVLDLSGVDYVFDSGLVAIVLLREALAERGVTSLTIKGFDLAPRTMISRMDS